MFVKVAPSTYAVKTSYRKDIAKRDEILKVAREEVVAREGHKEEGEEEEEEEQEEEEDGEEGMGTAGGQSDEEEAEGNAEEEGDGNQCEEPKNGESVALNKEGGENGIPESGSGIVACASTKEVDGGGGGGWVGDAGERGEEWVWSLSADEYATLSVERRVKILTRLVEVAMESGRIRGALEVRGQGGSGYTLNHIITFSVYQSISLSTPVA